MPPSDAIFSILVPRGTVATSRVICFPWSGGGTAVYARWGRHLPDSVEVVAVRLKGRENRYNEAVYQTKEEIIEEVAEAIIRRNWFCSGHVAFFGHSLGSILAVETALHLKNVHNLEVARLMVSGASAPNSLQFQEYLKTRNYSAWSDADLKEWLIGQGGTPKEVLDNEEFFRIHSKALRADLSIVENYKFEHDLVKSRLSCPITCFDGDGDVPHDQDSFAQLTTSREFDKIVLPGGHFYLFQDSNRDKILKMISDYFGGWDEIC